MHGKDMTQGVILRLMISFAVPILLGNLLQQLYNAFDAIVVGQYISSEALAAVGTTGSLINVIIAFFVGMSTGASVLISQYFGAKDGEGQAAAVHTAMLIAITLGLILSLVGIAASPILLRWMQTPEELIGMALEYLRIYFVGLVFLTVYNMGTAILRAMGDSRRPLYFLVLSSCLHIALNLLFVLVFRMAVAGVAWSTVISQAVSAVLIVWIMSRSKGEDRLSLRRLRFHWPIAWKITTIGLPGGIQEAIIGGSNLIVQAYFNGLGATAMAAYSVGGKLDAFVALPVQTMAMTVTTFVGQNLGAHRVKRARRGTVWSLGIGLGVTFFMSGVILAYGRRFMGIFTTDTAVVEAGVAYLRAIVPPYFFLCFTQILPGALRGAGDVRTPTMICVFSFVVLRQIYLFIITKFIYTIATVTLGFSLTWAIAGVLIFLYYRKSDWSRFSREEVVELEG